MTTYQISLPPEAAGIYMLLNQTAKRLYIGQTGNFRRRFAEWRMVICSGLGAKSHETSEGFADTNPDDWVFKVLKIIDVPTKEALDAAEKAVIASVQTYDYRVLNTAGMGGDRITLTYSGEEVTMVKAAQIIGCRYDTLKKRLRGRRGQGVVTVEELMRLSKTYKGASYFTK